MAPADNSGTIDDLLYAPLDDPPAANEPTHPPPSSPTPTSEPSGLDEYCASLDWSAFTAQEIDEGRLPPPAAPTAPPRGGRYARILYDHPASMAARERDDD